MKSNQELAEEFYPEPENKYPDFGQYINACAVKSACRAAFLAGIEADRWVSVEDKPLMEFIGGNNWLATIDTGTKFLAAVAYNDARQPGKELWWIRLCCIEENGDLHVITDDDTECAGWQLGDVTHYQLISLPPKSITTDK